MGQTKSENTAKSTWPFPGYPGHCHCHPGSLLSPPPPAIHPVPVPPSLILQKRFQALLFSVSYLVLPDSWDVSLLLVSFWPLQLVSQQPDLI